MKKRMLWNDIRENSLMSLTIWLFMTMSSFLFALACFLFVSLLGSVNSLMERAQTPDFLQMHNGEIAEEELIHFAKEQEIVRDYQTLCFLNLENRGIFLNGHSLSDSSQDHGVCVQSEKFDYLLDMNNQVIEAADGDIYVPVCYRQEFDLKVGETVEIEGMVFTISGFLRDSQMNSMMSSSKRFLVSESDYDLLKEKGSEEYLIEFLLQEGADAGVLEAAYRNAGLPANGPAITKPLIRMMNALSDGLMILIILLASVVLVLIAMLCIRFTLLTQLETDRREIGMLKAIGISGKNIRQVYFSKFLMLSGLGAVTGLVLAVVTEGIVSVHMQELYGAPEHKGLQFLAAFIGAVLTEGVLLYSVSRSLKRTDRVTAVDALRGWQKNKKQPGIYTPQYLIVALVIGLGILMMTLPQNIQSTISSEQFVTYMGIGDGEIRMDVRQTRDLAAQTQKVEKLLLDDERISRFVTLRTSACWVELTKGSCVSLNVEQGDHSVFPVTYAQGRAPEKPGEIALSYLCADEWGMTVGDNITLLAAEGSCTYIYTVCGIYSDITNGGKTAKAAFLPSDGEMMWSVFYVSLKNGVSKEQWLANYTELLSAQGISAKAVDIRKYVEDTYGQTIREIRKAAVVACFVAILVMLVVVLLFTRLLVAEDRSDISLRKAIGFTGAAVKTIYFLRYVPVVLPGILAGILAGNLLGESLVGVLLRSLGATGFDFVIDAWVVYGMIPGITCIVVCCAILLGLSEINNIKAYECCMGKE